MFTVGYRQWHTFHWLIKLIQMQAHLLNSVKHALWQEGKNVNDGFMEAGFYWIFCHTFLLYLFRNQFRNPCMWVLKRTQICVPNFRFMVGSLEMELLYNQVIAMHSAVQKTGRDETEYNSIKFPSYSCFRHTKMLWLQRRVAEGQV